MAYEKQTENILAGSVNVLPPVDSLPPQDALRILNFRADTQGSLVSRKGNSSVATAGAGPVSSICRVDAATPRRYMGASGSLYRNLVTLVSSGFGTTVPIRMLSFQNYLFALTPVLQAKDDGTNFFPWQITAPSPLTGAPTAVGGATLVGTYEYFVSYTCADGSESSVSSGVFVTLVAGQGAALSGFATYSPAGGFGNPVTGYNIYRGGGTQTATVLIASLPSTTTTYTDSLAEITAQESGVTLVNTQWDPPPPGTVLAGPYYDRLLIANSAAFPNRLWYSEQLRPYAWPGALSGGAGNWVDVGEQGEGIVRVTVRPNSITIYKQRTIWRLFGDPGSETAVLECVSKQYGAIGHESVLSLGNIDVYLNTEGIFEFNGEASSKISNKLNPIFFGEYPDVPLNLVTPMDIANRGLVALGYRRGKVYVSYPQQGQTGTVVNNQTLVYDLGTKNWVNDTRGFQCFYDEGQVGELLAGYGTSLTAIENGIDDQGTFIAVDYFSQFSFQGAPEQSKIYSDLAIEINTNGSPLTVEAVLDNGLTVYTLGPILSTSRQLFVFPYGADGLGLRGKNHAIRIYGTMALSPGPVANPLPCYLYKVTLHYIVQPRYSKTFDSDYMDCGLRDVKFCDFLELDIDLQGSGAGVYSWEVWSDRPRPTTGTQQCVVRQSGTFNDSSILGRRQIRIPFTEIEGQLFRVTLTADANGKFLLYAARLRCRPIGVYIDGANSENWQTKEIGVPF